MNSAYVLEGNKVFNWSDFGAMHAIEEVWVEIFIAFNVEKSSSAA